MNKHITTIIFDLGDVLLDFRWKEYLSEFGWPDETVQAITYSVFMSKHWPLQDENLIPEEEIIGRMIQEEPEYEAEIRKVYERLGEVVRAFDYTKEWIRELKKKGYKVYYLSNFPKRIYEQQKDKEMDFLTEMDGGILSCYDKCIKPNPEIYELLLERYGIKAEEAVFIDDRETNVKGAEAVGIHGIVFQGKAKTQRILTKWRNG